MAKVRSWVGLDVHARSVLAVTIDGQSGELRSRRLTGTTSEVVEFCCSLPGPTRVAYEAGPTGYGLARALHAVGVGCVVAAPGKIERPAQDKIKTDQRDAERVLRLLMIDALCPVRVPTVEEEALRDLVRAREDLRGDLMRARQRLSKLLLRHGIVYEDTSSTWTQRHRAWLRAQDLGGGAQSTLLDYLGAVDTLECRRGQLETTITELVPASPYAQTVARLRCLRGIDTLSAIGLAAEIGDFTRFERPGRLMSYLGLVPSESSSGETRRQGKITKTGSRHARRLLVEAAWHYRKTPARGSTLQRRQEGQSAHVVAISWQAQRRLHGVWRRLAEERGKRRTIVAVAVARELTGFCWALANAD
ncbi:MAG: IS110 family transposase [Actinobacteria bacterium]|nr:IS110 family transposase [Actinomycetota bacterium]